MGRRRLTPLLVSAALITALIGSATPAAATVPTGFVDELVATVGAPTALAFTPDGRLLITTQSGTVRVFRAARLLATPALNLGTTGANVLCSNSERGLLGITVDPQFASNGFVYLYYTFRKGGACPAGNATNPVNRVSRFTMTGNTITFSDRARAHRQHPFVRREPQRGRRSVRQGRPALHQRRRRWVRLPGRHPVRGIQLALPGDVTTCSARSCASPATGAIPAGNPYQGAGTARCNVTGSTTVGTICQETFSWGLRNPFRMAFDPNAAGTLFHINDVGQGTWEEIDLGTAGADYGWNVCEGF